MPTSTIKKYILIVCILVITSICAFLTVSIFWELRQNAERALESYAGDLTGKIENNIRARVLNIAEHLENSGIDQISTIPELSSFLEDVSTPEQQYILLIQNGGDFESVEQPPMVARIHAEPVVGQYTIQKVYDNTATSEKVATIFSINALMSEDAFSNYYIALLESEKEYADIILAGVVSDNQYAVLYSEWGEPIVQSSYTGTDFELKMNANMLKVAQSYHTNSDRIIIEQVPGTLFDYVILTDCVCPNGYFLAVYIDALQYMPILSHVLRLFIIVAGLVAVIVLFLILYRVVRKERMRHTVLVDPLTGVLNQSGITEGLSDFLKRNNGKSCCFVCTDVVAFHNFNAMYGYAAGDTLLVLMGKILQELYPLVFRLNSDVFAFIVEKPQFEIGDFDHLLYKALQQELGLMCAESVSIIAGVVPITETTFSTRGIVENALFAVREAKRRVGQNIVVYDQKLDTIAELKKSIEVNMIHALSKEEFKVYIQPKITMQDKTLCGGEALVRWQSDQMGFVMPDQFVPIFEDNGFVVELDFFMLTSVLVMLQERFDEGKPIVPISVNQSRVTIMHPNYKERLKSTLSAFTVPHAFLEFEITESSFEQDSDELIALVKFIKNLGFPVNMDDFGAGYSSLNILRHLPIDTIKIDKGFLGESDTSLQSRMIIKSVIGMSHDIGIRVICEGVETETQFDFLKESGCDGMQGYLYSKAVPCQLFFAKFIDNE